MHRVKVHKTVIKTLHQQFDFFAAALILQQQQQSYEIPITERAMTSSKTTTEKAKI
jgi:hypothetical protein